MLDGIGISVCGVSLGVSGGVEVIDKLIEDDFYEGSGNIWCGGVDCVGGEEEVVDLWWGGVEKELELVEEVFKLLNWC